jgi:hypothetical protein
MHQSAVRDIRLSSARGRTCLATARAITRRRDGMMIIVMTIGGLLAALAKNIETSAGKRPVLHVVGIVNCL